MYNSLRDTANNIITFLNEIPVVWKLLNLVEGDLMN